LRVLAIAYLELVSCHTAAVFSSGFRVATAAERRERDARVFHAWKRAKPASRGV